MKITIERETPAGMIYPPKPPPRHCGYIPDGSGVKWNAYDTMQMEAYARAAYADGFAAAQPVEPQEPVAWLKTMYSGTRPMLEVDHMTPPNLKSFPVYAAPPAPPAPAAVPPGYVLVPIEPTQAILDAPFVGKVQPQDWHSHKRSRELMAENYRAMIAAAGDKP